MEEQILEILKKIKPGVNFDEVDSLVTSGVLSSMNILMLVSNLEERFDVEIGVNHILPENFDNVEAIIELVERLQEE